ncbi:hypothetical protein N7516_009587 [Penicillium verrucosum]|uniref:uncharacterized protein n=1 Tax=Penicillium verrucosum TaxID=60171 RepID=UPI0025452044|nr:uncharacterized protein N7516_009587 [Penicillium verrucosum]KAJ5921884.1 hypothetical protein N7516_009587 [Penicillium verrucosum]
MEPPSSASVYRKAAESAIGTFVILFGANEIDDYMKIKDQYPTAWSTANMLVLNPRWPRESCKGKVEAAESEKSSSV